jgi:hypothetical protein
MRCQFRFLSFNSLYRMKLPGLLICCGLQTVHAQDGPSEQHQRAGSFSDAIEDNSFYIEEAYNQERGVVQHISTLLVLPSPQHDVSYTFTQEWPIGSQAHQLSFTIPYTSFEAGTYAGLGDIILNYRYQLAFADEWAAIAPRVSAILPTGDWKKGLGAGVLGWQFNIPASKRISDGWVLHANAGMTALPEVKGVTMSGTEVKHTLISYNVGGSVILLASPVFDVMLEGSLNRVAGIDNGEAEQSTEITVVPGMRGAIDIGELQIVPGLGVPLISSGGVMYAGVFLYLSFEHPF